MAGLDPAIHVFAAKKDVDHRDKPGDDDERSKEGEEALIRRRLTVLHFDIRSAGVFRSIRQS
jgi:hypothetical protein